MVRKLMVSSFGACLAGCGYRLVGEEAAPQQKLSVLPGQVLVAELDAVQSALAGARAELGWYGALSDGVGYPAMVVELLRIDEKALGIFAWRRPDGSEQPLARASAVGVVGRAWVEVTRGAPPCRDTGDVRRIHQYASAGDARIDSVHHAQAVRAAASELGRALARRVIGLPEPTMEPM